MNPTVTTTSPRWRPLSQSVIAFCSLLSASSAWAQVQETPATTGQEVIKLETITITADIETYHQSTSSMATKLPMSVRDIAGSLSIMNSTAIEDRNAVSIVDLCGDVTGATQSQSSINGFSFRGFPNTGAYTQNIQFDGIMGATLKKSASSAANVDSLEFLKGPNSVLYGQMNPGGLLNIVSKNPKEIRETTVRLVAGTYAGEFTGPGKKNFYSGSIDSTGPVGNSKKLLYRLVVELSDFPTSRQGLASSYSIYPSLTYKWSNDTSLTLKGETSKDNRQQDDGVMPIFNNNTAFGETATYYTAPHNTVYQDSKDRALDYGHALAANFKTTLGEWTLRAQARSVWHVDQVTEFTINNANVYSPTSAFARPTSLLRRQYNNVLNGHRYNHGDLNAYRAFGPENFHHTILVGVGGGWEAFDNRRLAFGPNQTLAQAVTLTRPVLDREPYPAVPIGVTDVATDWTSLGEYIADQIKLGSKTRISLGLRHDSIKINGGNKLNLAATKFANNYSTYTKQFGVVHALVPTLSTYGSWSQSLKPGSNLSFDSTGNSSFPPESGEQIEGGLKFETTDKNLNATFAVYQITRANVIVPSGTNFTVATGNALPGQAISRLDGEQKSKGVEFEVQWQPVRNWQLQAGVAHSKAQITQSVRNPTSVGSDLANAPRLSGNLWTRYNVPTGRLKGLGFGGGLIYVGKAWAGDPTTAVYYRLKAWSRMDASVYYRLKNYSLALNVQNVLDKRYIASAQSALTLNTGEQRRVSLSAMRKF